VKAQSIVALRQQLDTVHEPGSVTDADVLEALRTLLFTSSQFSYGVRGASFSAEDLTQIDLRAKDVVSTFLEHGCNQQPQRALVGHDSGGFRMVRLLGQYFFVDDGRDALPMLGIESGDAYQVHTFRAVMGRDGVRPTVHSCLHFGDAIRNHGEPSVM